MLIMTERGWQRTPMGDTPDEHGEWWKPHLTGLRIDHSERDTTWREWERAMAEIKARGR